MKHMELAQVPPIKRKSENFLFDSRTTFIFLGPQSKRLRSKISFQQHLAIDVHCNSLERKTYLRLIEKTPYSRLTTYEIVSFQPLIIESAFQDFCS